MRIRETPGARRAVAVAVLAVALPIVVTALAVLAIRFAPGSGAAVGAGRGAAGEATREVTDGEEGGRAPARAVGARAVDPVTPRRVTRPEGSPHRPPAAKPEADRKAAAPDQRPEIDARDAIMALREAGERGGIAAFPLPGTVPLKAGVIVPEGFELPEGYVRHYQVTDDGKRLPAVLMVHPDYELVDADGKPVAVPGGVVPPELAPPGMPIEMLEVPEQPGASGTAH